jgi:hypothetical protein
MTISDEERRRRQKAVDFGRASVGLEGFKPTKLGEEVSQRFVNGEITIDEAIKIVTKTILQEQQLEPA